MQSGGDVGFKRIEWFNGGIFDDDAALPLTKADIKMALGGRQQELVAHRPLDHGHAVRARASIPASAASSAPTTPIPTRSC